MFHDLVDGCTIDVGHLIELVDANNSTIGQNHGARLQTSLAAFRIGCYSSCETYTRRPATCCVMDQYGLTAVINNKRLISSQVRHPSRNVPVVATARGAVNKTYLNNWDFATLGSPIKRTFMSPRRRVPFGKIFSKPPSNKHKMARLMYSWPWIDGANDLASNWKTSIDFVRANLFTLRISSAVTVMDDSLFR